MTNPFGDQIDILVLCSFLLQLGCRWMFPSGMADCLIVCLPEYLRSIQLMTRLMSMDGWSNLNWSTTE